MANVKSGDKVGIVKRDVTNEDEKSGMYYAYFGGLVGTVDKVYDDNTACIDIDIDTLPQEAKDRHKAMEETERQRWLDSLSGEARSRLTPEQKQLTMSYKLLVSPKDLQSVTSDKPKGGNRPAAGAKDDDAASPTDKKGPAKAPEPQASTSDAEGEPKRKSEAEIAAAEEEYLRSLSEKKDV